MKPRDIIIHISFKELRQYVVHGETGVDGRDAVVRVRGECWQQSRARDISMQQRAAAQHAALREQDLQNGAAQRQQSAATT